MSERTLTEIRQLLESVGREGKLVNRYITALDNAGHFDGITKDEALSATRRFAALVENSAEETVTP